MMEQNNSNRLKGGMQHQLNIYASGTQGIKPKIPVMFEELEKKAADVLTPEAFDYVAGSAGSESTAHHNQKAFDQYRIIPRMMGDVSQRHTSTTLFGSSYSSPVLLAPVGVLSIVHPDAETAVVRAANQTQTSMIVSTVSSKTLEEIAGNHSNNPHWFQLYWGSNKEFTSSLIKRAENAGYKALVVTLDTRLFAWRERDIQNAYLPFLYGQGLANYLSDPVFLQQLGKDAGKDKMKMLLHFAYSFSNASSCWEDLLELKKATKLPLIVKGILHPLDAKKAIDHGADGIIVSNHGGRQMDGAIAALDALAGITDAVAHQTTILFDSGIRRGADVFKAMALGAKAVLLGRPYVYGLALAGEQGVTDIINNLLADTDLTLGLAGCNSWSEVSADFLSRH